MTYLCSVASTVPILSAHHYLGPTKAAGFGWRDEFGVAVFAAPRSRRLPAGWLELVRWCLLSEEINAGSRQWSRIARWFMAHRTDISTIVSYSDPSQGHTGALYRACNWLWAPTWHRLRPPPTGNGEWTAGKAQAVKDRWIFPLRPDECRSAVLFLNDDALRARMPWAEYREPRWSRGKFNPASGGGNFKTFSASKPAHEASA